MVIISEKTNSNVVKGCIKATRGPWLVRKTTNTGGTITKLRNPSDRERQNNKTRERKRRLLTKRIFDGLKAHGNYPLPKNADTNDLLRALCQEAGWLVDEDGTVTKKNIDLRLPELMNVEPRGYVMQEESYCECCEDLDPNDVEDVASRERELVGRESAIDLSLSL